MGRLLRDSFIAVVRLTYVADCFEWSIHRCFDKIQFM